MAEGGCLRDIAVDNLEVKGTLTSSSLTHKRPVVAITAARTIVPSESGTIFTVSGAGGAYIINLPTVANGSGCHFTFFVANSDNDVTISSNAANIRGNLMIQADTEEDNRVACAGVTSVLLEAASLVGDSLEIFGDGTNYYVIARGSAQGAFSTA